MPASPLSSTTWPMSVLGLRPAVAQQRHFRVPAHQGREPRGGGDFQAALGRACPHTRYTCTGVATPLRVWCPQVFDRQNSPPPGRYVAALITTVSGVASPCRRAAMLGVSPRASCSCRAAASHLPHDDEAGVNAYPRARRRPCARRQPRIQRPMRLQEAQPGPHGPQGIVFMGLRPAKIDEQPIAEPLRNMARQSVG